MKTSATPSATARARLGLIVSMTVFGTIGLFVRRIEITSAELALCRAGLAAVFLLLSFLVTRRRLCLSEIKKSLWLLLASGAAMGINWMLLFEAYQYTTISLATLSYYLAPVIVTALCPLLFHEKMTRTQVLCFLMSTLGVALIIGSGSVHGGASDVRGICFGVSAAVFYAAVILLNKYITGVPALERTFVQFLAAILVLAPYVGLTSGFHPEVLSATGWVNLLIVGFVHTGLTYCMYFSAIRTLPGQESSLLSYLDPIVSVLISVLLLGEPLDEVVIENARAQLAGFGLEKVDLIVRQANKEDRIDIASLQQSYTELLEEKNRRIGEMTAQLSRYRVTDVEVDDISREVGAMMPAVRAISLTKGITFDVQGTPLDTTLVCVVTPRDPADSIDRMTLTHWLRIRTKVANVKLFVEP